jgi:predicted RNA-binding Zn ribbon-like protein
MTGEKARIAIAGLDERVLERERRLPQPGGRQPAPGELVLLQSFLNTHFDLVGEFGAEILAGPERLLSWFTSRGLVSDASRPPSRTQVQRVIAVREGLRELARCNRDPGVAPDPAALRRLNDAAARVSLGLELGPNQVGLFARDAGSLDSGVGTLLAIAVESKVDGHWQRMKACPGEHCGWVFYDHSRNNSSQWCSMAVCGGRTKARAHYRRWRMRSPGGR